MSKPFEKDQFKRTTNSDSKAAAENNFSLESIMPALPPIPTLVSPKYIKALDETKKTAARHLTNANSNAINGGNNLLNALSKTSVAAAPNIAASSNQVYQDLINTSGKVGTDTTNGAQSMIGSVGSGLMNAVNDLDAGAAAGMGELATGLGQGAYNLSKGNLGQAVNESNSGGMGAILKTLSGLSAAKKSTGKGLQNGLGDLVKGFSVGKAHIDKGAQDIQADIMNGVANTGIKTVSSGAAEDLESTGMNAVGLVTNLMNLGIDSTAGYYDHLNGPKGKHIPQSQIPKSHQFDEFMTDLSYHGNGKKWEDTMITEEDENRLTANGYDSSTFSIHYLDNGLQMVTVEPLKGSGANPHVSFRGSELNANGLADWGGDTEKDQVGDTQFESNQAKIYSIVNALTKEENGKVNVSGHSLGGALAQRFTANHPEMVNSLTTFQAPGQSPQDAELYNRKTAALNKKPDISHHFEQDGTVYKAGETHLPGNFYVHETSCNNIIDTHLTTLTDQTGRKEGKAATRHSVEKFTSSPNPNVRKFHENSRKAIGFFASDPMLDLHKEYGED